MYQCHRVILIFNFSIYICESLILRENISVYHFIIKNPKGPLMINEE